MLSFHWSYSNTLTRGDKDITTITFYSSIEKRQWTAELTKAVVLCRLVDVVQAIWYRAPRVIFAMNILLDIAQTSPMWVMHSCFSSWMSYMNYEECNKFSLTTTSSL